MKLVSSFFSIPHLPTKSGHSHEYVLAMVREFLYWEHGEMPVCGWTLEKAARKSGSLRIAGWTKSAAVRCSGPVVAAAVILPNGLPPEGAERLKANPRIET